MGGPTLDQHAPAPCDPSPSYLSNAKLFQAWWNINTGVTEHAWCPPTTATRRLPSASFAGQACIWCSARALISGDLCVASLCRSSLLLYAPLCPQVLSSSSYQAVYSRILGQPSLMPRPIRRSLVYSHVPTSCHMMPAMPSECPPDAHVWS